MVKPIPGMSLADLPFDCLADVVEINAPDDPELTLDLMRMGVVPGARLHVVRRAPLGDPLQVDVMGSHLAIRRGVALHIRVLRVEEQTP
jgi:ferrous iron transport protein A